MSDSVRFSTQLPDLVGELLRDDALLAQRPESLEGDGDGEDRAQDDRHHDDAAGLDDFEHVARFESLCSELPADHTACARAAQ